MAFLPLRSVSLPAAADASYEAWLDELDAQLDAPGADWPAVVRQVLLGLYHPEHPRLGRGGGRSAPFARRPGRPAGARPEEYYPRTRVLRGRGPRPVRAGQAAALALVQLRPRPAGRAERGPRRGAAPPPGAADLRPLRPQLQVLPARRVLLRLQHGRGRRRGDPPARPARRPGRPHARRPRQRVGLRQHLQPHAQHRGPAGRDQRADRPRGRHPDHLPRDGARRRAGGAERHGRRQRGRDQERPAVPRQRRHSRQVGPRQAERAGRDAADRPGLPGTTASRSPPERPDHRHPRRPARWSLAWSWRARRRQAAEAAALAAATGRRAGRAGRLRPPARPPHQRDLLAPGTELRPLRIAADGAHRGAGGPVHLPVPRGRRHPGGARLRGAPRAPDRGGGGLPEPVARSVDPVPGGRPADPGHRPRTDRAGGRARAGDRARRRRAGGTDGRRTTARARHDARRHGRGRAAGPPLLHPGSLADLDGRHAGGRRPHQQPLLQPAAPRQGRVGDHLRRPFRGHRAGGRRGRITRANRALALLAGVPLASLVGRPFVPSLFTESEAAEELIAGARLGQSRIPTLLPSAKLHRTLRLAGRAAPRARGDGGRRGAWWRT